MTKAKIKAAACAALAAALIGGVILANADRPARAVEAKTVRAAESGYCVIPGRPVKDEPGQILPDPEPEPVMVERDLRVDVPLIRGCVPSAAAETSSVTAEAVTPSPEGTAWDAQEAQPAMRYLGQFKITGYDTCARCCGKTDGITASGTQATVGRTCAASKDLPFGARLYIEGIGERIVEDRGGGVNGNHIDVLVADHPAAYAITGTYAVYLIEED